jgi:sugar lactone lactonase YvrE
VSDAGAGEAYEYSASSGKYLRDTLGGGTGASGVNCVSYHGGYIWLTSENNNKALEYNASTGAYVRELSVTSPDQIIFTGSDIFIVSTYPADSVLEYNSSGTLVHTVVGRTNLGFLRTRGMAMLYDGDHLWVANSANNSVTVYSL